jgi:hypothetical protein
MEASWPEELFETAIMSDGWTGGVDAMQVTGITRMTSTGSMKNGNKPFRTAAPWKNTIFLWGDAAGIGFMVAYEPANREKSLLREF